MGKMPAGLAAWQAARKKGGAKVSTRKPKMTVKKKK